jgi:hypothetical protein
VNPHCSAEVAINPDADYPTWTHGHQAVRDLAESCFGPVLLRVAALPGALEVTDCEPALTPGRRRWLEGLDRAPEPLFGRLAGRSSGRLGMYYEQLWHFFLAADPDASLLAHNLPAADAGRTVGEFDCLYLCRERQRPVHLELAVKFYLGDASDGRPRWYGPNARDRLDLKLDHMLSRQVRLSEHPAGRAALAALDLGDPLREVALHGCLFQPWGAELSLPQGYNPACPTGTWLRLRMLDDFAAERSLNDHLVLPRLRWLSPACRQATDRPASTVALRERLSHDFRAGSGPALVAALDRAGRQRERFFVVPDDWPGQAALAHTPGRL